MLKGRGDLFGRLPGLVGFELDILYIYMLHTSFADGALGLIEKVREWKRLI